MNARLAGAALLAVSALEGCATIINGSTQVVHLQTDPPGAHAEVFGQNYTTPAAVELPRGSTHVVRFKKAGYEDAERVINQSMSGYVFIDSLLLMGVVIDLISGGFYELEPPLVQVRLNERLP